MKKIIALCVACLLAVACFAGCTPEEEVPQKTAQDMYKPVWLGDTVYEESLVVVEEADGTKVGKLLYEPTEIIRVNDYTLKEEYAASEYRRART